MPKKPPRKYGLIKFVAADVFPPSSELAMDILRLMAAYNDVSEVLDWMIGTRSIAIKRIAGKKARIRMSIQNRILLGLMHETFQVIDQMQGIDEFKEVKALLPEGGLKSLKNIQLANSGKVNIRSRLRLARHSVAFHYDRESFAEGASIFSRLFVERARAESLIIFERGSRACALQCSTVCRVFPCNIFSQKCCTWYLSAPLYKGELIHGNQTLNTIELGQLFLKNNPLKYLDRFVSYLNRGIAWILHDCAYSSRVVRSPIFYWAIIPHLT
jgi:hypothetical protein